MAKPLITAWITRSTVAALLTYQGGYTDTDIQADQNYASGGIKPVRDTGNMNAYQFLKYENNFNNKNTHGRAVLLSIYSTQPIIPCQSS